MADETITPCAAEFFTQAKASRFFDEPEGERIPAGLEVIDSHVHLFPPRVFEAIWRWFDKHAWSVRYRLYTEQVIESMRAKGVSQFVALLYSHKPGMSAELNRYLAEAARAHPQIIPFGTVLPGEPGAREIVREAFTKHGLRGLKLHCHVQQMAADDPRIDEIYRECEAAGMPVVNHAGREPSFPAYGIKTREICSAAAVDRVMQRFPKLKLIIPHLGCDEFEEYSQLIAQHEHLYLDTTMSISELFNVRPPPSLFPGQAAKILYGTDFPNLPYAWDRELKKLLALGISAADQHAMLAGNAQKLFG